MIMFCEKERTTVKFVTEECGVRTVSCRET